MKWFYVYNRNSRLVYPSLEIEILPLIELVCAPIERGVKPSREDMERTFDGLGWAQYRPYPEFTHDYIPF